jgi:hypothetical protein
MTLKYKMRILVDKMLNEVKLGVADFSKRVRAKSEIKAISNAENFLTIDESGFSSALILNNVMYSITRTGYSTGDLIHDKNLLILLSNMNYYFDEIKNGIFKDKLVDISKNIKLSMESMSLPIPEKLEKSISSNYSNIPYFINASETLLLQKGKHDKNSVCKLSPVITKFRTISEFNEYVQTQNDGVHMALLLDTKNTSGTEISFSLPVFAIKNGTEIKLLFDHGGTGLKLYDLIKDANNKSDEPSSSTSIVHADLDTQNIIYFIKDASTSVQLTLIILTNYIANYIFKKELPEDSLVYTSLEKPASNQLVPVGVYAPKNVTLDDISFKKLNINPIFNWIDDLLSNKVNLELLNFNKEFKDDSNRYAYASVELTDSGDFSVTYQKRDSQWGANSRLLGFSNLNYGTKEYLDSEKQKVARFNKCVMLQHLIVDDFKKNIETFSHQLANTLKSIGSEEVVSRIVKYAKSADKRIMFRNKGKKLSGLTRGRYPACEQELQYTVTTHGERVLEHIKDDQFKQKCYLGKHNITDYIKLKIRNVDTFDAIFDVKNNNPLDNYLSRIRLGLIDKKSYSGRDKTNPSEMRKYPESGNIEESLFNIWSKYNITILIPVTKSQVEYFETNNLAN